MFISQPSEVVHSALPEPTWTKVDAPCWRDRILVEQGTHRHPHRHDLLPVVGEGLDDRQLHVGVAGQACFVVQGVLLVEVNLGD